VPDRAAVHGRDVAHPGHCVDDSIGIQVGPAAACEWAASKDRTVLAIDAVPAWSVEHVILGAPEEVTVAKQQWLLHVPLTGQHDVALVEVPAGEPGQRERLAAAAWNARCEVDLGTVDALAGDHVDHASNRV